MIGKRPNTPQKPPMVKPSPTSPGRGQMAPKRPWSPSPKDDGDSNPHEEEDPPHRSKKRKESNPHEEEDPPHSTRRRNDKDWQKGPNTPQKPPMAKLSLTSPGKESKRPRRESSPSTAEETPAWSKLMTARFDNHFKLLETQLAEVQIQIGALTSTMGEFHSAFNNPQRIPSTDED
ncbi:uncharacterized protein LOC132172234 isoform X2 [Corylus avellana]|uniref:uncharacterized protein LOC132172234 isoform X2 n=1 Tax=Corylus avellana TaxID=13451 RepID=UPI00286ADE7E|nr:uncharacterized protein LOC132172234 isoform X2 [Corylus avellana]